MNLIYKDLRKYDSFLQQVCAVAFIIIIISEIRLRFPIPLKTPCDKRQLRGCLFLLHYLRNINSCFVQDTGKVLFAQND